MDRNLNTVWARLMVEELIRCGVDYFCISPGSRSTPLVAAVARNRRAQSIICYDERVSAFHALGYARATGKPAAAITTSGTAVANLYPAVVEASTDHVPIILLTADRPPELTDAGANQTMNQQRFFGDFVAWQFDLPCPDAAIAPEFILTTIDHAVYRSTGPDAGPVHINCRYREPLEPDDNDADEAYLGSIGRWNDCEAPFTSYARPTVLPGDHILQTAAGIIGDTDRGILVVGRLTSDGERSAVLELACKLNWTIYTDITSGLRLTDCPTHIIRYFDQQLLTERFNARTKSRIVLHLGGRTTSKRVGRFFDVNRPDHYIVIKDAPERYDPIHAVTMHIQADVACACRGLCERIEQAGGSDYMKFFTERAIEVESLIGERIAADEKLSEPFISAHVSEAIPKGMSLFLSSSMPIRDMDLYGRSGREGITVAANRGISGIDGVISSAAGFAAGSRSMTTLIIGDLAFIHDLNALSTLHTAEYPVIIILVNNKGGGIFHFLPISQYPDIFEDYFATPHDFSFAGAAETFRLDYYHAETKEGFIKAYQSAVNTARSAVIEVSTDREDNLRLRRSIKKEIIDLLNSSVET